MPDSLQKQGLLGNLSASGQSFSLCSSVDSPESCPQLRGASPGLTVEFLAIFQPQAIFQPLAISGRFKVFPDTGLLLGLYSENCDDVDGDAAAAVADSRREVL